MDKELLKRLIIMAAAALILLIVVISLIFQNLEKKAKNSEPQYTNATLPVS